ncbi:MAG: FixH family protein [Cyclobacteriaceae bacterium]
MNTLKILSLVLLVLLYSCDSDEPQPEFESDLVEITSVTENGLKVTILATQSLFVGYNSITAKVEDENGNLIGGDIAVLPLMDMTSMVHSCPLEVSGNTLSDGEYQFNAVFVMPSGEMGSWSLDFTINDTEISVPVEVSSPELSRLVSFTSAMDESTKYFVAYIDPQDPQVGQNDLEIAVFKKQTMMEWPAVDNLEFELEPWMVSMDHGSPNNLAPVHTDNGHYIGTVNFTMTGDWQLRLTMKEDGQVCGTPYFDLYFQ